MVYLSFIGNISYERSHLEARHGAEMKEVRGCMEHFGEYAEVQGTVISLWEKTFSLNGNNVLRRLVLCQLEDGRFAIRIFEILAGETIWREITGFIRTDRLGNPVYSMEEILHYLSSTGWSFFSTP